MDPGAADPGFSADEAAGSLAEIPLLNSLEASETALLPARGHSQEGVSE